MGEPASGNRHGKLCSPEECKHKEESAGYIWERVSILRQKESWSQCEEVV